MEIGGLKPAAVAVAALTIASALELGSSLLLNPSVPRHHVVSAHLLISFNLRGITPPLCANVAVFHG